MHPPVRETERPGGVGGGEDGELVSNEDGASVLQVKVAQQYECT